MTNIFGTTMPRSYLTLLPREIRLELIHYVEWRPPRVIPQWQAEFTEYQEEVLEWLCGGLVPCKRIVLNKNEFVDWIQHEENNNLYRLIRTTKRYKQTIRFGQAFEDEVPVNKF